MKKLSLLLLVFAFAQTVFAQNRFFFMPELGLGATSVKIASHKNSELTEERTFCSNLNFGVTLGKTEQKEKYRYFVGALLERNGYGFQSTCYNDNEDINVGTGSWKFGFRVLLKQKSGFIYGGTLSFITWDDIHTVVESEHDNCAGNIYSNPNKGFAANGHVGYGWNHVMLLFNLGYESGIKCCATAAFPFFFME